MTRRDGPQVFLDAAKAQTGAALLLARCRLLIQTYTPAIPARFEALIGLASLIEEISPRGGQRPRLVYRPAQSPAKRSGHDPAGATTEETT